MTFDQVLVFHTIVKLGGFKSASDAMHRTQPAISLAIKKLEEELSVELFDRSGYRPVLTEHGKLFFERSRELMHGMEELEGLAHSFRGGDEPLVSVAIDGISPLPKILKLCKNFGKDYPHTKLNLSFDILSEAERRVLESEAQIGITHFVSNPEELEVIPITTMRMIPVMSEELFNLKSPTRDQDLLDIDQIVVSDKNQKSKANFGLLSGGRKWKLEDPNFKKEIIMASLGWGHLPEHTIETEIAEKKLVVLNFKDVHPRELIINLIRPKKNQFGKVAEALWQELKNIHQV